MNQSVLFELMSKTEAIYNTLKTMKGKDLVNMEYPQKIKVEKIGDYCYYWNIVSKVHYEKNKIKSEQ